MNRNKVLVFAGVLLLLPLATMAAVCGGDTTQIENSDDFVKGITVSGEGKVSAPPDVAEITLGVSTLAPTVAEARDQAATSLDAVITSLRDNGVADEDIQTQGLSIYPEYDYTDETQVLRGFRVSNNVLATIREIDRTSEIIDDAVNAGGDAVQISGISFTIDDPKALQDDARRAAVDDARARAQTLADAGGVGLGEPIIINEGASMPAPIPYERYAADAAASQAAPETPILTGELDVTVIVTVMYAIN